MLLSRKATYGNAVIVIDVIEILTISRQLIFCIFLTISRYTR